MSSVPLVLCNPEAETAELAHFRGFSYEVYASASWVLQLPLMKPQVSRTQHHGWSLPSPSMCS